MPVITVHRYSTGVVAPSMSGTQFIDGDLTIESSPATKPVIKLARALYNSIQSYVLFKYTGSVIGSLSDITIDDSDLTQAAAGASPLSNDTAKKQVILTLISSPTNGTQYIDGDLVISGTTAIKLDKNLYKTAGTYVLFDVGGTITGSVSNIQIEAPAGRAVDPALSPNPYIDGNQIKVKLI